jgi:hypothetical protein
VSSVHEWGHEAEAATRDYILTATVAMKRPVICHHDAPLIATDHQAQGILVTKG